MLIYIAEVAIATFQNVTRGSVLEVTFIFMKETYFKGLR